MRGPVGLVIGLVIGAGAMYLVLRPPWAGGSSDDVTLDAGVVASAPNDAGKHQKKKPGKHRVQKPGDPANPMMTIDEAFAEDGDVNDQSGQPALVQVPAGEQRLEKRGRAQLAPTKISIDMGPGGGEARSLTQSEIQPVISSSAGGVRDCVVKAATNTNVHGTITVTLAVDGSGAVTSHMIEAPKYLLDHGLYDCTSRAVGRMKFPSTGGSTLVDFPVNLN